MTSGIGFLNKNGIVLAVDSRATDEHGMVKCDNDQKLFMLDENSGLIIAGYTPSDDPENDITLPPLSTAQQLRQQPPTDDTRRDTILRILTESFCRYFLKLGDGYVHFILGDYDATKGYLLLKCSLGYVTDEQLQDDARSSHRAIQVFYQTVCSSCPGLFAQAYVIVQNGNGVPLFAVGVVNELQVVEEYLTDYFVLPGSSLSGAEMAGWLQPKACDVLEAAISKIANHRDKIGRNDVNKNIRVATIDKDNGFQWVKGEIASGLKTANDVT